MCGHFFAHGRADLLQLFSQLGHQGMTGHLLGHRLQLSSLKLFFFAQLADTILSRLVPLLPQLITQGIAGFNIFSQLVCQLPESVNHLLIFFAELLFSQWFGIVANLKCPRPADHHVWLRNWSSICGFDCQRHNIAFFDRKLLQWQTKFMSCSQVSCRQSVSRKNPGSLVVFCDKKFHRSQTQIVCRQTVQRHDVIGSHFGF